MKFANRHLIIMSNLMVFTLEVAAILPSPAAASNDDEASIASNDNSIEVDNPITVVGRGHTFEWT